jgi:hypothetical protein
MNKINNNSNSSSSRNNSCKNNNNKDAYLNVNDVSTATVSECRVTLT